MQICQTIEQVRQALAGERCALVPTMGNLHDGHIALMRSAAHYKQIGRVRKTAASVFVNRLQFLPHEDFDSYPRTFGADCEKLQAAGCDVVFAPLEKDMYPQPQVYKVHPAPEIADILEGHFRPGFFVGVSTVVAKLFNIMQPALAIFGQKDYQQLMVIRQLVQQMAMPIEVVGHPIERAFDGLALSSRNGYLNAQERIAAVALPKALQGLIAQYTALGANPVQLPQIETLCTQQLDQQGWKTDYLTLRRRVDLQVPQEGDGLGSLVALGAARLGSTRLIDNFEC